MKFCGGILQLHLISECTAQHPPELMGFHNPACNDPKQRMGTKTFSSAQSFQTPPHPLALWEG